MDNVDIGLQYGYPWPDEDWNSIQDYKSWLNAEWDRVEKLEYNGPTHDPWPKKPKTDIKKLGTEGLKKKLIGKELHDYLVKNCVNSSVAAWPKPPVGGYISLESMKDELIVGYNQLKQLNCYVLGAHIGYGDMLNKAFLQHFEDKYTGKIPVKWFKWEDWLQENVGINSSYGRKLRNVAKLLKPFPRFQWLGLSFSEVYNRLKEIESMLHNVDKSWAAYWSMS